MEFFLEAAKNLHSSFSVLVKALVTSAFHKPISRPALRISFLGKKLGKYLSTASV